MSLSTAKCHLITLVGAGCFGLVFCLFLFLRKPLPWSAWLSLWFNIMVQPFETMEIKSILEVYFLLSACLI